MPSDAILRITLADVEKADDVGKWGEDELWWFDADRGVLSKTEWQTIQVLFKKLRSSYGYGTRHNNGKKDLSLVVGYELNLISRNSRQNLRGAVLVNNVRAYRDSM